jgi:hypothetical protein
MNRDSVDGIISISVGEPLADSKWYKNIIFYLRSRKSPVTMNSKEIRTLKMKANQYVLITDILFRRNYDGILLRCIDENQSQEMIRELHEGICGGNFAPTATTQKIIRSGFYWTSMFRELYAMIRKFVSCQHFSENMKRSAMPLQPVIMEQPFSQRGLDVVRPINLKYRKGHMCILTDIDYFTKWMEVAALKKDDPKEMIKFLKDNILLIFGVLDKFITDNGSIFIGQNLHSFVENMESSWFNHRIIIYKVMALPNPKKKHM